MTKPALSVSVVITCKNEAATLPALLEALEAQSYQPQEIIIVDGQSDDGSSQILDRWSQAAAGTGLVRRLVYSRQSTISQGRNFGIEQARSSWIACTDAGCVPERDWLAELVKKAEATQADVVAGYTVGDPRSAFETAQVPFVLVPPEKVDPESYLPAARSVMFKKSVWTELGGFPEDLVVSEDYAFFKKVVEVGFTMTMTKSAQVSWRPRPNLLKFVSMVSAQARYDEVGGNRRPKVSFLFFRYFFGGCLLLLTILTQSLWGLILMSLVVSGYLVWSIAKHYRHWPARGWYYFPLLQLAADLGVLWGTSRGLYDRFFHRSTNNS